MHRTHLPRPVRSGFTLIELLVVIAIIAIMAAILFPVFAQARDKARQASCLSNGKQLGTAMMMYNQDYDETFPSVLNGANSNTVYQTWDLAISPYVKNDRVFICPSADSGNTRSHVMNAWVAGWTNYTLTGTHTCTLAAINEVSTTLLLAESWVKGNATKNIRGMWVMSVSPGSTIASNALGGVSAANPWGDGVGATRDANGVWQWRPGVHLGIGYNPVFCDGHAKFTRDDKPQPNGPVRWYP